METRSTIIVITGDSGCGKTTLCARVVAFAQARGMRVTGVLTPPRVSGGCKIGMDVLDICAGERRALAELADTCDGPATGKWHFHADGLAWGADILRRATPCDLLVIDELGPLELVHDEGWTIGIELLRAGRYRFALVVVRTALLPRFRERIENGEPFVLNVTSNNQDAVFAELTARFEEP